MMFSARIPLLWVLGFLVWATCSFNTGVAEETIAAVSHDQEEILRLAERLDQFGYHKSALHYYKILQRNPNLDSEMRSRVEASVTDLEKEVGSLPKTKVLPEMEAFPQMKIEESLEDLSEQQKKLHPHDFPHTRINKKKWILTAVAIVGISIVAYRVNKNLRKKPTNSIQVEF